MAKCGVSLRRGLGICLVQCCLAWLLRDTSPAFAGWSLVGRPHGQAAQMARFSWPYPRTMEEIMALEIEWDSCPHLLIPCLGSSLNRPYFNGVATLAAYRQLVKMERGFRIGELDWDSSVVLLRLHARVEDLARDDQLGDVFDEILLSIAKLSDRLKPSVRLVSLLVESSPGKVNGMSAQGLSNSLEACARLKDIMPVVLKLVPDISVQIRKKAKDMAPSALSNCLWAYAQLRDSVLPYDLQTPFQALAVEIPDKARDMKKPDLSKCLWALAQLEDVALFDVKKLVPVISAHMTENFNGCSLGLDDDFSIELAANFLWAFAKLKDVTFSIPKPLQILLEFMAWRAAFGARLLSPSELRSCTWAVGQLLHPVHLEGTPEDSDEDSDEDDWFDMFEKFDIFEWEDEVAGNESLVADFHQWTMAVWWFHWQPECLRDDAEEALTEVFAGNLNFDEVNDGLRYRAKLLELFYYKLLLSDPLNRTDLAPTVDRAFYRWLFHREKPVGSVLMMVFLCARHGFREDEVLTSVSDYFVQTSFSSLSDFELCSLSWAYQSLAQDDFRDFQKLLTSEVTNRGLSRADVKRGQHGIFLWRASTVSDSRSDMSFLCDEFEHAKNWMPVHYWS